MKHHFVRAVATVCVHIAMHSIGHAQQAPAPAAASSAELAKKLAESDLGPGRASPLQFNWEQDVGPSDADPVRAQRPAGHAVRASARTGTCRRARSSCRWCVGRRSSTLATPATSGVLSDRDHVASSCLARKAGAAPPWGVGPVVVRAVDERADARDSGKWSVRADGGSVAEASPAPWTARVRCGTRCGRSRANVRQRNGRQPDVRPAVPGLPGHAHTHADRPVGDDRQLGSGRAAGGRCRSMFVVVEAGVVRARSRRATQVGVGGFAAHPGRQDRRGRSAALSPCCCLRHGNHQQELAIEHRCRSRKTTVRSGATFRRNWRSVNSSHSKRAVLGAALTLVMPLAAQQPPASPAAGTPTETPTKKDPLRFTAFNVSMPTGIASVTEIAIERWSTVAERTKLLEFVETAKSRRRRPAEAPQRAAEGQAARRVDPHAQQHGVGNPATPSRTRCRMARGSSSSAPTNRSASRRQRATRAPWTLPLHAHRDAV